jgi:spermidine synthase
MKPTRLLDRSATPDGTPLTLHEHDGTLSIRVGGIELMSTRQHHSVVAELVPAVIAWNRDPAYGLAADVLDDPRVEIFAGDVGDVLDASRGRFDAVMLDVDNGARGLTAAANDSLYGATGLGAVRAALRPGGRIAVWSAGSDPRFATRLEEAGFAVDVVRARTHPTSGSWNSIFLGTRS